MEPGQDIEEGIAMIMRHRASLFMTSLGVMPDGRDGSIGEFMTLKQSFEFHGSC